MSLGQGVRHFCSRWLSVNCFVIRLHYLPNAINMSFAPEHTLIANDVKVGDDYCPP